jgi:hypothetical protein
MGFDEDIFSVQHNDCKKKSEDNCGTVMQQHKYERKMKSRVTFRIAPVEFDRDTGKDSLFSIRQTQPQESGRGFL